MERVLVTGARGFIGSQLCRKLAVSGVELHAVSRQPPADLPAWWQSIGGDTSDAAGAAAIHWWNVDLVDLQATRELIRTILPDKIYHLASLVTGSRSLEVVLPILQNNFTTAFNLLLASAQNGAGRIVLAGSLEEPDDLDPVPCSPYAAAKGAASGYARLFGALYQTEVVTAKIAMVYGPGQMDLTKFVPYVTTAFLRGERPKLSSGIRLVDWICVDDVVDGLVACGHASGASSRSVDLGSGEMCSIREIVQQLRGLIADAPEALFGAVPDRPLERLMKADVSASYKLVGWSPSTTLQAGLRRTVDWYKSRSAA
ncbi:NAD-dependent epimerase/dehydratase family protein [Bradyrhizobium sp. BWA-3-5]|uniref:NAD-dependent epimerase/dehydratase family protein n=1 Tax=Bradyrhizobium sp. BWA-3-5 TaxID=3080013 RepID=UPI00293EDB84|nr:SDR family NAD(P)-dependent oxidoreductase [Bradyrhizobium sp. BWA-3-5]WOH63907.1 SDR family NAD(P)-dependent oxidoreductase [Bradyrhizobium sp. BWA-3-5]